jgi:hypothetical protein
MAKLKLKKYGSLAEYFFPNRPEYSALVKLRMKLFDVNDLQEVLDYVHEEISKIEKREKE